MRLPGLLLLFSGKGRRSIDIWWNLLKQHYQEDGDIKQCKIEIYRAGNASKSINIDGRSGVKQLINGVKSGAAEFPWSCLG